MNSKSLKDNEIYYFIGNITSHVLHALPLWKMLGGTFIVTSQAAKQKLDIYNIPVICVDDIPYTWKWSGKKPHKQSEYITLGPKFKNTSDFLNNNAKIVLFYELFEFSRDIALTRPKKIFLTHGNMLKNYLKMYPHRLEILKTYDYMAALGPFMKAEFLASGIASEKLVDIGIARTDELFKLKGRVKVPEVLIKEGVSPNKPIISYLPTFWGDSSVEVLGPKILKNFPDGYQLLFRPHPQTPQKIINKYLTIINEHSNLFYLPEKGPNGASLLEAYAASSAIIGDLSSVMLEAVLLDKPLIFAQPDTQSNVEPHNQIADVMRYSQRLSFDNIQGTPDILSSAIDRGVDSKIWHTTKQHSFYNYDGTSVEAIANFVRSVS